MSMQCYLNNKTILDQYCLYFLILMDISNIGTNNILQTDNLNFASINRPHIANISNENSNFLQYLYFIRNIFSEIESFNPLVVESATT